MVTKFFKQYNGTKAAFISAGLPETYFNNLVIIKGDDSGNGSCLYTRGVYVANFSELIAALNYVKGISVDGTSYNAAQGGGYIDFAATDPATIAVNVDSNGIKIGLTTAFVKSVNDVIATVATINGDYLKAEDRTALEKLVSDAKAELLGASTDTSDKATIYGVKALAQEGLNKANEVAEDMGNVDDLSTTNKEVVKAINEVLAAVGTGGTAATVTITEKGANGNYAQSYEVKQGTTVVGTINIPKDLVVKSGQVVTNPAGQAAGTYIELTLQNSDTPLYINVADLIDVYTAQASATQVQLAISADNVISATIVAGSIGSTELADNAVTTIKIADLNVTKGKLSTEVQTSLGKADTAYQKPAEGISSADMTATVQASLAAADAAAPQATTYTKGEVDAMFEWEVIG